MSLQVKFWPVKHPWKSGDFVMLKKRTRGMYTFDMLADDISHHCSLTRADVAGCMEALIEFTTTRLMDGYTVQYQNFGNFFINPDTSMLTAEDFSRRRVSPKSVIKAYKIRFIPCIKLRNKIKETTVELM